MITRRDALKRGLLLTGAFAMTPWNAISQATSGAYRLPALPYPVDALEPYIDAQTMSLHHGKHHATYVTNLNKALSKSPDLAKKSAEDLMRNLNDVPANLRSNVKHNAGGHVNHTLFWQMMKKNGGGQPKNDLGTAIEMKFGTFAIFKDLFTGAALRVFGSGWAWLVWEGKELKIETTSNQDSPLMSGRTPVLGIDVWEHAYYIKYQNRRADYIEAFYNVINWDFANEQYQKALKG